MTRTVCIYIIVVCMKEANQLKIEILPPFNVLIKEKSAQFSCSIEKEDERILVVTFKFFNYTSDTYSTIASFFEPRDGVNATIATDSDKFVGRVSLRNPTPDLTTVYMDIVSIRCDDDGMYLCDVTYLDNEGLKEEKSKPKQFNVTTKPSKPDSITSGGFSQVFEDGQSGSFICKGNVGNPPGRFLWRKINHFNRIVEEYSDIDTQTNKYPEECTFHGTSNLTFQLHLNDDKVVIECVEESQKALPNMTIQTAPIIVISNGTVYSDLPKPVSSIQLSLLILGLVTLFCGLIAVTGREIMKMKDKYTQSPSSTNVALDNDETHTYERVDYTQMDLELPRIDMLEHADVDVHSINLSSDANENSNSDTDSLNLRYMNPYQPLSTDRQSGIHLYSVIQDACVDISPCRSNLNLPEIIDDISLD